MTTEIHQLRARMIGIGRHLDKVLDDLAEPNYAIFEDVLRLKEAKGHLEGCIKMLDAIQKRIDETPKGLGEPIWDDTSTDWD